MAGADRVEHGSDPLSQHHKSARSRVADAFEYVARCPSIDPDSAREGRVLAVLLAVMIFFSVLTYVIFLTLGSSPLKSLPDLISAAIFFLVFLYNRRGNARNAALVTIGLVLLVFNVLVVWTTVQLLERLTIVFLWTVVIVLAGALLKWRTVVAISVVCCANVWIIYDALIAKMPGLTMEEANVQKWTALPIIGFVGVLTSVLRYQSDLYQRSLRERNSELDRLNGALESEVRARTRDLVIARDAALSASRVKGDFLNAMSHELKTPLNAVLGMTDLLLGTPLNQDQRELVETTRSSGAGLLSLINDILDYAELDTDAARLESRLFNVRTSVEQVLNSVSPLAARKGLELRVVVDSSVPPMLIGDVDRLQKVLLILLRNALKFTASGEISAGISAEAAEEGAVRLRGFVRDTGIGIAPDRIHQLFTPFGQIDTSLSRKYGGTGIGLVICKQIIRKMGGAISVESEPGVGTTFTFEVRAEAAPVNAANAPPIETEQLTPQEQSPPLRILLAEDNVVNQKVARLLLRKLGYDVDIVANGLEAVTAVEKRPYDVVLMDLQMPEMDGLEATRVITERVPEEKRPRIVAFTAHTRTADREQCIAAGMTDFVSKPVSISALRDALDKARKSGKPSLTNGPS